MSRQQRVKVMIDNLMGACAGEGIGPTETAMRVQEEIGAALSPRQVMNIWIGGDAEDFEGLD